MCRLNIFIIIIKLNCLKIIHYFVKVEKNVYKLLTRAPRYILIKSFFLAIGWSYLHDLSQTFLKRLKLLWGEIWNYMSKALRFLQITAEHQDCPFFTVFLNIKTLSQNISITLLQNSLKLHEHRGRYWRKKLSWTILEEQFPVSWNTAASKYW